MDKSIWFHPFASYASKYNILKKLKKQEYAAPEMDTLAMGHPDKAANTLATVDPWIGLFEDPALHEALDRLMKCNRIV
jgi:hypothetical protein